MRGLFLGYFKFWKPGSDLWLFLVARLRQLNGFFNYARRLTTVIHLVFLNADFVYKILFVYVEIQEEKTLNKHIGVQAD